MDAKSYIIEKDTNFTHFALKMLHTSASKSVHTCTFATVTVHICMITVVVYFIFLILFSLTSQVTFPLFSTGLSSISFSSIQIIKSKQIIKIIKQILDLDRNSSNPYSFLKSKAQTPQTHLQNHIIKPIYKSV